MKNVRLLCAASALSLVFSLTLLAGEIHNPHAAPTPETAGEISTTVAPEQLVVKGTIHTPSAPSQSASGQFETALLEAVVGLLGGLALLP